MSKKKHGNACLTWFVDGSLDGLFMDEKWYNLTWIHGKWHILSLDSVTTSRFDDLFGGFTY